MRIRTPLETRAEPPRKEKAGDPPSPIWVWVQALGRVGAALSAYLEEVLSAVRLKRAATECSPTENRETSGPRKPTESRAELPVGESGRIGSSALAFTLGETTIEIDDPEWVDVPEVAPVDEVRTQVPELSARATAFPFAVASSTALLMARLVERETAGRRRRRGVSAESCMPADAEEDEHE